MFTKYSIFLVLLVASTVVSFPDIGNVGTFRTEIASYGFGQGSGGSEVFIGDCENGGCCCRKKKRSLDEEQVGTMLMGQLFPVEFTGDQPADDNLIESRPVEDATFRQISVSSFGHGEGGGGSTINID